MNLENNQIYSFKLNSGEEMVAKVVNVDGNTIEITEPVSIAPNQKGIGMIPSMFTTEMEGKFRLNTNSIAVIGDTNE